MYTYGVHGSFCMCESWLGEHQLTCHLSYASCHASVSVVRNPLLLQLKGLCVVKAVESRSGGGALDDDHQDGDGGDEGSAPSTSHPTAPHADADVQEREDDTPRARTLKKQISAVSVLSIDSKNSEDEDDSSEEEPQEEPHEEEPHEEEPHEEEANGEPNEEV